MAEATKLDSLVDKIYQEGVEKSNKEAAEIIDKATQEAETIQANAKREAKEIVEQAGREAEDMKRNALSDVKLAGDQAVSALKQRIKDLVAAKVLTDGITDAFVDASFLKELILAITKSWSSSEGFSGSIEATFPESMKSTIDDRFRASIQANVNDLKLSFDGKMKGGFTLAPTNGAYQITFTDEDFIAFFTPFVKEKTESILFSKHD